MTSNRRRSDTLRSVDASRAVAVEAANALMQPAIVVRVLKIGGRAQEDPMLIPRIREAASAPGARMVVVHGGGDEVSALQRRLGVEPQFIDGRRVTSPAELDVVRMVLSGRVNKRIVSQLQASGLRPVGVSGEDGGLLTASVTDTRFGRVGRDVFADASLLADLLNTGWLPVISPLARDRASAGGDGLNVNGDDAAAAVAAGLGADELLFVADVPGVMRADTVLSRLDTIATAALVSTGIVQGGMKAKLEAAAVALRNGVPLVRIASIDGVTNPSAGTIVTMSTNSTRDSA